MLRACLRRSRRSCCLHPACPSCLSLKTLPAWCAPPVVTVVASSKVNKHEAASCLSGHSQIHLDEVVSLPSSGTAKQHPLDALTVGVVVPSQVTQNIGIYHVDIKALQSCIWVRTWA